MISLIKMILLISITIQFSNIIFPSPLFAFSFSKLNTIIVTDKAGQKEKITADSYLFYYSERHHNNANHGREFFELYLNDSPKRSLWVNFSQIKMAYFEKVKDLVKVSITLDNGNTLNGIFTDPKMMIEGKGEFGNVKYEIGKVKSIEFLEFQRHTMPGKKEEIVNREEASSDFKKNRNTDWKKDQKIIITWTIEDGDKTIQANNLYFRDWHLTNVRGSFIRMIHIGDKFDDEYWSYDANVLRGTSKISIRFPNIKSLEITGKKLDNKPEVIITTKDDKQFSGALLMRKFIEASSKNVNEDSIQYGMFDKLDMLVWDEEYGQQGISFFPLRRILLIASNDKNGN